MVEAAHACYHQEVGALLLHLNVVEVQGVGDVHVVLVHESDKLVGCEAVDLDAGEVEVVAFILGQHLLEEHEGVADALHQPPEDRVTQAGGVQVQGGRHVRISANRCYIINL